jgi:hypothetical protein
MCFLLCESVRYKVMYPRGWNAFLSCVQTEVTETHKLKTNLLFKALIALSCKRFNSLYFPTVQLPFAAQVQFQVILIENINCTVIHTCD